MSSVLRDNAVLVQAANEDADVDVTGDAADYVPTSFARDEVAEKTSRQGNWSNGVCLSSSVNKLDLSVFGDFVRIGLCFIL